MGNIRLSPPKSQSVQNKVQTMSLSTIKSLTQTLAQQLDVELMSPTGGGFSIDQLMELAGLAVAECAYHAYPPSRFPRPLIIAGPGNNGGDGLVAARHLWHFGYKPTVLYPKRTDRALYHNLTTQLHSLDIPFAESCPVAIADSDFVIDAIFGFSFKGDVRAPFHEILKQICTSNKPVLSIDIPSGWDVEIGPQPNVPCITPATLISLTFPKPCSIQFKGRHYIGGRFVPPTIARKYGIGGLKYEGTSQCFLVDDSTL